MLFFKFLLLKIRILSFSKIKCGIFKSGFYYLDSIFIFLVSNCTNIITIIILIRKQEAEWTILTAAKLIAPAIAESFAAGYEWLVCYMLQ